MSEDIFIFRQAKDGKEQPSAVGLCQACAGMTGCWALHKVPACCRRLDAQSARPEPHQWLSCPLKFRLNMLPQALCPIKQAMTSGRYAVPISSTFAKSPSKGAQAHCLQLQQGAFSNLEAQSQLAGTGLCRVTCNKVPAVCGHRLGSQESSAASVR